MSWIRYLKSHFNLILKSKELERLRLGLLQDYLDTKIVLAKKRWPRPKMAQGGKFAATQATFFFALFALLAKMAEADGTPSIHEVEALERFATKDLRLSASQSQLALQIFRKARTSSSSFQELAKEYAQVAGARILRENMIFALLSICLADGHMSQKESRLLSEAAGIFGLNSVEQAKIRAHFDLVRGLERKRDHLRSVRKSSSNWQAQFERAQRSKSRTRPEADATAAKRSALEVHYRVLGCAPTDSISRIKKTYRKLALQHHPDRAVANGLSREFLKMAERRFREIQRSYEEILSARPEEK